MKKKLFLITLICIIGCDRIDETKLEVIEGIKLGCSRSDYKRQLDSLNLKHMSFFSQTWYYSFDEIEKAKSTPISDIFNLNEFKNGPINHYAILVPSVLSSTDNFASLVAVMGHTDNAMLVNNGFFNLTTEYGKSAFNQNLTVDLVSKIKEILITQYGEPTDNSLESNYFDIYILEGEEMNVYGGIENRTGKMTIWETEYMEIKLFEGLPSVDSKYFEKKYQMVIQPTYEANNPINHFENGESPCVSFVYIKYELKDEIIKKLKLNEKKI